MKYLSQPCTRCERRQVVPPLKKQLDRLPILVRCDFCGKCSRYNIVDHADGSQSYALSKWGRGGMDSVRKVVYIHRRHAGLSSADVNLALDKSYPPAV